MEVRDKFDRRSRLRLGGLQALLASYHHFLGYSHECIMPTA